MQKGNEGRIATIIDTDNCYVDNLGVVVQEDDKALVTVDHTSTRGSRPSGFDRAALEETLKTEKLSLIFREFGDERLSMLPLAETLRLRQANLPEKIALTQYKNVAITCS
jgi:hypothetical protein